MALFGHYTASALRVRDKPATVVAGAQVGTVWWLVGERCVAHTDTHTHARALVRCCLDNSLQARRDAAHSFSIQVHCRE